MYNQYSVCYEYGLNFERLYTIFTTTPLRVILLYLWFI